MLLVSLWESVIDVFALASAEGNLQHVGSHAERSIDHVQQNVAPSNNRVLLFDRQGKKP